MPDPVLILASASPRRRALLQQLGVAHEALPAAIDETPLPDERAADFVRRLSVAKAGAVAAAHPGRWVLGADTAVIDGARILGKPLDRADGIRMLQGLGGHAHRVLTGIALAGPRTLYRQSESHIRFRPITSAEANAYWDSGEPADKAGGYAVQGYAAVFVEHLAGSYSGVMGLPLFELAAMLSEAGFALPPPTAGARTPGNGN